MAFHFRAAYDKTLEIYTTVLGEPGRSLRFASVLVWPYLALSLFVPPGDVGEEDAGTVLLVVVHSVLFIYVSVTLAVRWHRQVIFGEDPASWTTLPLGLRELRYLGKSLVITLVCFVAGLLAFGLVSPMFAAAAAGSGALSALLIIAGLAAAFMLVTAVMARLGLALPATAVDRPGQLMDSWNLTREHWRPFWMLLLLVSIPEAVALTVTDWFYAGATSPLVRGAAALVREAVFLAGVAAYAIALSFNYLAAAGARPRANGQDLDPV